MTLKDKVCDLLDTDKKGYITIGDIGLGILWMGFLMFCIYSMYNGVFVLGSIIFSPNDVLFGTFDSNIQNLSGTMSSLDMLLGTVGAVLIIVLFLCASYFLFLWFIQIRVTECNTKKEK